MNKNIIDITPKRRVLIIGKGYIGSNLSTFLAEDNALEVYNIERVQLNYLDKSELHQFFETYKDLGIVFDYVVNAVGFTGDNNIDDALDNKELCYILNTVFPVMLSNTIKTTTPDCKLINISSGCIYNGPAPSPTGWTENDVPNFGICDDVSSFYSKTKHSAELLLSYACDNTYNLRIRMPFGEIPSNRNLFQKLFKYTTLLNASNSITYVYDLFNMIYNIVISDVLTTGVYNIVNDGHFNMEMFIEAVKRNEKELIKSKFITNKYLKNIKLVDEQQFCEMNITKENRSSTILDNSVIKSALNTKFQNITVDFIDTVIKDLIENATTSIE